jgi:hypothetical protein
VSEQQAEDTHAEPGSVGAGSTVPPTFEASSEAADAVDVALSVLKSPAIAPNHEAPPSPEEAREEAAQEPVAELRAEPANIEVPKQDAPRTPAKVLIMAPSDRVWHDHSADLKIDAEARSGESARENFRQSAKQSSKRSFPAMAAMLALATIAGAIGGAVATTGFTHVADAAAPPPASGALEASIARIDSDIVALKAGLEHNSKAAVGQFNKTSDRLDKIEKAQAEPNTKLAKLTEAVDKLRTAPAVAPAQVAAAPAAPKEVGAKEVTGSVTQPAVTAAAPAGAPPKSEVGRLPTVDGWKIADVGYGSALIESRRGTFEVMAGDFIPGLGRIDAIRKQDGHWVVVTSKGLIVSR